MVLDADDCLAFLTKKFEAKTNPKFYCRKISVEARTAEARLKKYPTIEGSTLFKVMVIKPNSSVFKENYPNRVPSTLHLTITKLNFYYQIRIAL